jgi:hypothetical protein
MARLAGNGAIVSDSGEWYYDGFRWKPLMLSPTGRPPGFVSAEGRQLLRLVKQSKAANVGAAGEELSQLVVMHGDLPAAESALNAIRGPEVQVKTYRSIHEYERDAPKMAAEGWVPQGQISSRGKINMGRTLGKAVTFLPWAILRPSRQSDPITVTWTKP